MTLYELSLEYERSADMLWGRIAELKQARKETEDEVQKTLLEGRIRPLRAMYRETRAAARHLGNYYRKYIPRRDNRPAAGSLYPLGHRRRN